VKKVAVFVEGQSEQVFVKYLLHLLFGYENISFECFRLVADSMHIVPYKYSGYGPTCHFLLIDVGGDERVLSVIKERERSLYGRGFSRIIALRDMYGETYRRRSPRTISEELNAAFIKGAEETIATFSAPDKIGLHFSIMEFEAWLLGVHSALTRSFPSLTTETIQMQLGIDLACVDPQTEFYHPSSVLKSLLAFVGINYRKKQSDIEGLCSRLSLSDIEEAVQGGKCASLAAFIDDIRDSANA